MKVISPKNVMEIFYYLMIADEKISEEELQKFEEIGLQLDEENFNEYKDEVIAACEKTIENVGEDDHYDYVIEGVDSSLKLTDGEDGISSRLLVWNMLVIAFCNKEYSSYERRLIRHIMRRLEVDENVFHQMEGLVRTNEQLTAQLQWLQSSDRAYAEIAPYVKETEKRIENILMYAKSLIDDEINEPTVEAIEIKPGAFENMKSKTGKMFFDAKGKINETAAPLAENFKQKTTKLFTGLKSKKKSKEEAEKQTDAEENTIKEETSEENSGDVSVSAEKTSDINDASADEKDEGGEE